MPTQNETKQKSKTAQWVNLYIAKQVQASSSLGIEGSAFTLIHKE